MPLITLHTWPTMTKEQKKEFIFKITELTTQELQIVPDKIQVLIQELEKENWGKAGSAASNPDFAQESRVIDWETKESYHKHADDINGMAVVTIDVWNTFDQATKDRWVQSLTQLIVNFTHAPLDKVLIVIREMIPGNWGQSGVTGADKDFLSKSRTYS
ncbi:tautomerase family protein [Cohnella terricola]|uniref:4-oxalocrotonate tautomerase n=1 Tax=Cohnella terricola TaxID=1289167 RepID=A0A559JT83_9BACL|nr:tautomerase family protein [Cohnella terricola]TVY03085.1 4-oxalocrotonate tautomerase [Cohnella terricola]